MTVVTDPRCTLYRSPGHPERPQRISRTVERLRQQTVLPLAWAEPAEPADAQLLRAHSERHLARLRLQLDFDGDTPGHPGIDQHARRSVGGALRALALAREGRMAFSLLRPPGHHATEARAMGFCYLNSIAVAVLEALAQGLGKVAVFDFDVHHGNGTEAILLRREHCLFISIHQYPAYPGTGQRSYENACNHPVPPHASRAQYRTALSEGLAELRRFEPALIAVSAGFDAYSGDPLAQSPLEHEDYFWLGQSLRLFDVPLFNVLEGGYSDELPELIFAYLQGLAGS
jgi:acetoin utilization deacetylase AcuC-like enzyme